jgi:hypothetical protein
MIRTYARRVLSPFVGLVQVAEAGKARALSLDGRNWAVQYSLAGDARARERRPIADPNPNFSLVASIEDGTLKRHAVHPFLEPGAVRAAINALYEAVTTARLPFTAADRYEYWLLDQADEGPLALLHSCVDEADMARMPRRALWLAMPAAQLEVPAPEAARGAYVPPVNYRLQKLVEERAGARPRAAWFERTGAADDFPPCLLREDWADTQRQRLCDLYLRRLAPRLLMLQGLARPLRHRLERAARAHPFDVERFYPLYPEVVEKGLLNAARVEAQLRRTAEARGDPNPPGSCS